MIIKSMSRKHPSFAQLIDYIERESKLKSRGYSIHHNLYSRDKEQIKEEFLKNSRLLRFRKNGVYLYHEVLSISRSATLQEEKQKTALQTIVREYLKVRAGNNIAYAVLHEDTDNLHFHIVLSANEVGSQDRKRLSKSQFSDIQTRLEAWVFKEYQTLEQKAVFHQNQTREEQEEREAKRSHLSNRGEEMKRRGARATERDNVQEILSEIFSSATNPRQFSELMEQAGFTLYTRGQTHGVTDRAGNKYRLNRLGLADAWQALDKKMMEFIQAEKTRNRDVEENKDKAESTEAQESATIHPPTADELEPTDKGEDEVSTRLEEIRQFRAEKAKKEQCRQDQAHARGQSRDDRER